MVRTRDKKQKGDESFEKRTQKVGRKKLAPATSTRAEVNATGLRVGVARTIVEEQNNLKKKQNQPNNNNNNVETFSGDSQYQTLSQYKNSQASMGGGGSHIQHHQQKIPDITSVLVAINHYKAGSRTQALKNASVWVRSGKTATESPSLTIQLLTSSLAALSDSDGPTRDAASAVISAIDQCVLIPSNSWSAVAESVCDRLNICLTHATMGVRATAVQLLSDLSSPEKHDTRQKLGRTFLSFLCSFDPLSGGGLMAMNNNSNTTSGDASSGSNNNNTPQQLGTNISSGTRNAMNVALGKKNAGLKQDAAAAATDSSNNNNNNILSSSVSSSLYELHDENIRSLVRNAIMVVKTKPMTHFPLLPSILKTVLSMHNNGDTSNNNNTAEGNNEDCSSSSANSGSSKNSFSSRNHEFLLECLSEVWDFGCIRVKEQFETTVSLFRDEPSLRMVLGILDSTSILTSAIANQVRNNVLSSATSSSASSDNIEASSLFPRKQLLSNIIHMTTARVPFSMQELASPRSTSPRKAQLATSLGSVYLSLLQMYDVFNEAVNEDGKDKNEATISTATTTKKQKNNNSTNTIISKFLPASEIRGIVKKSLMEILEFGFSNPVVAASAAATSNNNDDEEEGNNNDDADSSTNKNSSSTAKNQFTSFTELTCFAVSCLSGPNSFLLEEIIAASSSSSSSASTRSKIVNALPALMMSILKILDSGEKLNKTVNNMNEEAIFNLIDLVLDVSFVASSSFSDNNNIPSELKEAIIKCWEKMIQFHFLLRGSSSSSEKNDSEIINSDAIIFITSLRQRLVRRSMQLMYEFVSTACRDMALLKNLLMGSNNNNNNNTNMNDDSVDVQVSSSSSCWSSIFASLSTIVAMIRQQQQTTTTSNEDAADDEKEIVHLGSSFLPKLEHCCKNNNNSNSIIEQQQRHETRILAFGTLHFAGILLRFLNEPVPSSWTTLLESKQLPKELFLSFHQTIAQEYLRLLQRILV